MKSLDKSFEELSLEYGPDVATSMVAAEKIGRDVQALTDKLAPAVDLAPDLIANLEPIERRLGNIAFAINQLNHTLNDLVTDRNRFETPTPTLLGRLFFKKGR